MSENDEKDENHNKEEKNEDIKIKELEVTEDIEFDDALDEEDIKELELLADELDLEDNIPSDSIFNEKRIKDGQDDIAIIDDSDSVEAEIKEDIGEANTGNQIDEINENFEKVSLDGEESIEMESLNDNRMESTVELDENSSEIEEQDSDIEREGVENIESVEGVENIESVEGVENIESVEEEEGTSTVKELTEKSFKKNIIEAAIFIAGQPISVEELGIKLDLKKKEVEELVYELAMEYMDRSTSIEIVQIGNKFSMQIKAEYTERVKRFSSGGLIPEAIMRTLTIVALRQPIKKSLLIKLRGSGAYQHVKFLEERGFLDSYKKGRTSMLTTTEQFSDQFGLSHDLNKLKKQLIEQLGISPDDEDNEDSTTKSPE
ncbi:MAG: SMC-Scp complex subunit ScpB [Promethearchaeota archaeon]